MLKKMLALGGLLVVCLNFALTMPKAEAAFTQDKYKNSSIYVITLEENVALYAEPVLDSLILGIYPKGTSFVPINQHKSEADGTLYNLVIRADGAVGWVIADKVAITRK